MSRTEQAIQGLVDALQAAASETTFLPPTRNEALSTQTKAIAGLRSSFNIWDGEGGPDDSRTLVGTDVSPDVDGFELNQRPQLELIFEGGTETARAVAMDAALIAIDDVLRADRTLNGALGAEGWAMIERVDRAGSLATDGLPGVKGAIVTVLLVFTSNRPF
jgi:hypothetical protein